MAVTESSAAGSPPLRSPQARAAAARIIIAVVVRVMGRVQSQCGGPVSTPKGSAIPALVVVELMGPLLSGADPLTDALSEVLAAEGLESRPGALEQARGMAARPALERMLVGHGRHDLLEDVERIESLLGLKLDRWQGAAPRLAAGAGEALARLTSS